MTGWESFVDKHFTKIFIGFILLCMLCIFLDSPLFKNWKHKIELKKINNEK